ncbi:MAG TPA: carbamoyltransferase HypF [Vicinamibacterales bacterium]|jgi:hydrogenase maturation protein HypF|nr:carbamoyltransferase HypF [Vicinamibacterales bacterium]
MVSACSIRVRGVVQGVGFRPFVFRLAREHTLAGWVLNAAEGVDIHLEGPEPDLRAFVRELEQVPPKAAVVTTIEILPAVPEGLRDFSILESRTVGEPTVRISPDLPLCEDCLRELFDPADRRFGYAYITCTNCGPRYSVILGLPYDRANTTMKDWPLDEACAAEYHDPADRRFHAEPLACAACGPGFELHTAETTIAETHEAIRQTAQLLNDGAIVAIKGIGGYHLACDARNTRTVDCLRQRKYRKEKPFAVMVRDRAAADQIAELSALALDQLLSVARPIVLAPARERLPGVALDTTEIGLMLPYTPLHYLLFAAGAPDVLVMTSANRSSEPIAYDDRDALEQLSGIADAFLIGQRPIARRVDDSVVRAGRGGPMVLRRARGYAPGVAATLPTSAPILALGADLKNTITLVVSGQAIVSQHIGDLDHYPARQAFARTIADLTSMYGARWEDVVVAHDAHPEYASTAAARELPGGSIVAVQHHRAHIASVIAERGAWDRRVLGVSLDGTGYGDDGTIWGGEIFAGSVVEGFERVAHLRSAALVGGDAAARHPVQAATGFVAQVRTPDLTAAPFHFGERYTQCLDLLDKGVRTFSTTSMGRLFDAAAALAGFTRSITFEGQAAMWLEQQARLSNGAEPYAFPFDGSELDFRPLLQAFAWDRRRGRKVTEIALAFHRGVALGMAQAIVKLSRRLGLDTIVLSGGVFQNAVLLNDLIARLDERGLCAWINRAVPPNDGGISLGQAALVACRHPAPVLSRAAGG